MSLTWPAPANVLELLEIPRAKYHSHLETATFAIAFDESKPFIRNRFNWGSLVKFSDFNKLWQQKSKYDFCITICSDVWHSILDTSQKEALLDLHLTRCEIERVPETIIEGKKKKVVKDEWGRVKYTNEIKFDKNGNPKWQVMPLDLDVFSRNIRRYGLWCPELSDFQTVLANAVVGATQS